MTTNPSGDWRPAIRALIYCVMFERNPLDAVDRAIQLVVDRNALERTRDDYRAAIGAALASHEPLNELLPQAHSDVAVRRFLQEVHRRLTDH